VEIETRKIDNRHDKRKTSVTILFVARPSLLSAKKLNIFEPSPKSANGIKDGRDERTT
jgi:hypothetical protein